MLNSDQQKIYDDALYWFYNSSEQIFEIAGAAGTGKTFLMMEILRGLGLKSDSICAVAYTGAAALVMRRRGFVNATTIHSAFYYVEEYIPDAYERTENDIDAKTGRIYKRKRFVPREIIDPDIKLIFVDEAYMVPMDLALTIIKHGIKVIACGDPNQLDPIGNKPFFLVSDKVHRLTQIMRQTETNPIVYLSQRILNNEPIHNGCYGPNVLVINDDEVIPQYYGLSDVILCGTNKTRDIFNYHIRHLAGFDDFKLPRVGERLICRQNNWDKVNSENITLVNGLAGTVMNQVNILNYSSMCFKLDFLPDNANCWFDGLNVNYEYFISDIQHRKEMKDMNTRYGERGEFFEFAYALTTSLAQGSEYNNVFYYEEFLGFQDQKKLNYTAITRAKERLIYVRHKNKYY